MSGATMEPLGEVAEQYADFAVHTRGESECYEEWSLGVVGDEEVLAWIGRLVGIKQQPNLVFAAARWHGVPTPGPYAGLRDALLGDDGTIRATIARRSTQTNEARRMATLTPVLATLPGPLALVEVGASAGLCLYPDRYDYSWAGAGELTGCGGPVLTTEATGPVPVPAAAVRVAWRGGVDLNPLDVEDDDAMAWLANLVWPGQDDRLATLRDAIAVARTDPPHLVRGDLRAELPALVEEASAHGTVVVFNTSVIAYLDLVDRAAFAVQMADLVAAGRCHWISSESPNVLPEVVPAEPRVPNRMVLALDGRQVAWTHGHGRTLSWL